MLTPQEVSERSFSRASFVGYQMAQVDEFLDVLTQDYTALYNDNAVLKSKLKVLVDKVEEYRSTEEAMRRALRAAQRQADELVEEAQKEKARIKAEAEAAAKRQREQVAQELAAEEYRLQQAKESTAAFVAQVQALNAKQAEYLSSIQDLCPPADNRAHVEDTAAAIDSNMKEMLNEDAAQTAAEEPEDLSQTTEFAPVSVPQEETEAAETPAEEAQEQPQPRRYNIQFVPFRPEDKQEEQL